jgi:hypothetical protein
MGVDIVGDPHREDDDGYNWTRLRYARQITDVVPGSVVVMGSRIGTYLAKVVAWDFEVSDDDPIVTLDLLPVTPDAVERALARSRTSAARRRQPGTKLRYDLSSGSAETHELTGELGAAPSRQRHPGGGRQLTGELFDLGHHQRGERLGAGPSVCDP